MIGGEIMLSFNVSIIKEKDVIKLTDSIAKKTGLVSIKMTLARFGFAVADIKVVIDDTLKNEEICISENVIKKLKLPISNKFHLKVKDKEIVFGPYIGIYLGSGRLNIGWKYERLRSFVKNFDEEINGAMVAFTEKDINYRNLTVDAYCYDSIRRVWKRQEMPLPSVLHRYGDMNRKVRNRLAVLYGKKLFNYDEMDKWTEISALQSNEETKEYIPETILCENIEQFKDMVSRYSDLYFKPVKGRKGRGIHRIIKLKDNIFRVTIQAKTSFEEKTFYHINELINELQDKITSGNYIIQKTINLTINNRVIDFRIRFEKDWNNEWKQSIFAARVSDLGGVVSNRSAGGGVFDPYTVLTEHYQFDPEKANAIMDQLIDVGFKITKAVESAHLNYGKCAVDLGLEADGTIYHIESNVKAPNDLTTRAFEEFEGLDRIGILNSQYAKSLTGFKDNQLKLEFEVEEEVDTKIKDYHIILGSSSRTEELEAKIFNLFKQYNLEVNDILKRKFHIEFRLKVKETELLKIFKKIQSIDKNNFIRSILYGKLPIKKRIKAPSTRLVKENKKLKKELEKMKKSTSWKISKPIRVIGKLFRR